MDDIGELKPVTLLLAAGDYQTAQTMAQRRGMPLSLMLAEIIGLLCGHWRLTLAIEATGLEKDDPDRAWRLQLEYWQRELAKAEPGNNGDNNHAE
jgi:hypothetical protein